MCLSVYTPIVTSKDGILRARQSHCCICSEFLTNSRMIIDMCITRHQRALGIEHHTDVQSAAMAVIPLQALCRCLLTARIGACLPLAHLMHFSPKVTPACRRASRCGCCHSCCRKGQPGHSFLPKGQPPPMPARDGFLASSSLSCSTRSRSLPFTFDGIFTRTCTWAERETWSVAWTLQGRRWCVGAARSFQ